MPLTLPDGVRLAYWDHGSGQPPLVLIHGWLCDHTYLAPQAEHFGEAHRIVSLDLRGHGASAAAPETGTMANFAADVVRLCDALELRKPVLIGHSMGGVVSFEAMRLRPDLAAGIVLIDSPVATAPVANSRVRSQLVDDLRGPGWQEAARAFVENMFMPEDDPVRRARIVDGMSSQAPELMATAMESMIAAPSFSGATAPAVSVPVLAIARAGREPLSDLKRLAELCPRLYTAQVAGAGHFCQLEVPDQVNAMIARFLALL